MEMADAISLELVAKQLVTNQLVLYVSYDRESLTRPEVAAKYHGEIVEDHYGRPVPKPAHGTINLSDPSSSSKEIIASVMLLYDRIVNRDLLIRRLNICTNNIVEEGQQTKDDGQQSMEPEQLDLFTNYEALAQEALTKKLEREKERRMQEALINIKRRFGKNAILKGTSYAEGATARLRNKQIGGHKA